ncbi:VOC family protein [Pseudonocardia saturnea]
MRIDLTLDCADAVALAQFWKLALGYEDEPPPAPFTTRAEWAASFLAEGETDEGGGAWLRDPAGVGPRLCLLDVPERKTAKNRLHMDVRVGGWDAVTRTVALLRDAGGTVVAEFPGHHVVMADPEGNEFCVA